MEGKQAIIPAYLELLIIDLDAIERDYIAVIEQSEIKYVNPDRHGNGLIRMSAADWGWAASTPELEVLRMALLRRLRDWEPRFRLLFRHPTPEVSKRLDDRLRHLERWLVREYSDCSIPRDLSSAVSVLRQTVESLRGMRELLPSDPAAIRVVVDTNALLDEPDLAAYRGSLGDSYVAHLMPVVLGELDEHKRGGRNETLREAARRADRRLKGIRNNGDVQTGVRVVGEVWAVFEHIEPCADGLPSWLNFSVPDDRFVASTLLLQSRHPGSCVYVATSDLNLQTKLAAVGLPFLEPPE